MNEQAGPKESDIAQKAAEKRRPVFNPMGRIEHITSEETKVADVRRHPFGLILIYIQIILGIGISLAFIFFLLPDVIKSLGLNAATANASASLFGLVAIIFGLIFLVLVTKVYKGNQLIVTDVNVTQVLQIGLFNRKISELSMANVEDVTAEQKGIFPTLLNYGTLRIETAGEQNNFIFVYCPNPNAYAKTLLDARQRFLMAHGG